MCRVALLAVRKLDAGNKSAYGLLPLGLIAKLPQAR